MPSPYVSFDGNCAEAFAFYETALDGKLNSLRKFKDAPSAPSDAGELVMHASITIQGSELMGSDCGPWSPYKPMQGVSLYVSFGSLEACQVKFDALAEGGTITMPFAKTFWSAGFGMVTDKFGVSWMISCDH